MFLSCGRVVTPPHWKELRCLGGSASASDASWVRSLNCHRREPQPEKQMDGWTDRGMDGSFKNLKFNHIRYLEDRVLNNSRPLQCNLDDTAWGGNHTVNLLRLRLFFAGVLGRESSKGRMLHGREPRLPSATVLYRRLVFKISCCNNQLLEK